MSALLLSMLMPVDAGASGAARGLVAEQRRARRCGDAPGDCEQSASSIVSGGVS